MIALIDMSAGIGSRQDSAGCLQPREGAPSAGTSRGACIPDARYLPDPVLAIEVLPPSTKRLDKHTKLSGYFCVPSIQHCVVVDAADGAVFPRRRGEGGLTVAAILREGDLALDPPGLTITAAGLFGA